MWQDNRIQAAIDGTNPMVMAELPGGFAVFGDVQFLPGYKTEYYRSQSSRRASKNFILTKHGSVRRCGFGRLSPGPSEL